MSTDLEAAAAFCAATWPEGTRPTLVAVEKLQYSHTGKRDRHAMRRALPELLRPGSKGSKASHGMPTPAPTPAADGRGAAAAAVAGPAEPVAASASADKRSEASLLEALQAQLLQPIGPDSNFFAAGGNSFKALRVCSALDIPVTALFAHPSAAALARALRDAAPAAAALAAHGGAAASAPPLLRPPLPPLRPPAPTRAPIVVAGMALRLPGAASVDELWRRLQEGDDLLGEPLPAAAAGGGGGGGVSGVKGRAAVVARKGRVLDEGVDLALWGLSPAAAQRMGIEQRVLLGLAYEALQVATHTHSYS